MSETRNPTAADTRFMRDEPHPSWPGALEDAARRFIAAGPAALREYREAALASLRRHGLPRAGSEEFTFVRPGDFLPQLSAVPEAAEAGAPSRAHPAQATAIMPAPDLIKGLIFPECRESYAVLLDGEYSPVLSKPGAGYHVGYLEAEASPAFGPALLAALGRETDAAASLASLFAPQPLLIRIDPGAAPPAPLQILHLRTSPASRRRDAWLAVTAGRLSESRLLVRHAEAPDGGAGTAAAGSFSNLAATVLVEDGASVKWLESSPEGAGNEGGAHFHKLTGVVERDGRLFVLDASTGSRLTRKAYAVDLRGTGADAEIHGATVLADARQSHRFVTLRHLAAHCTSRQHFKTVAADKGKASVDGTILVAEGAQQTNADQLINNLMLSDEARADSKPRLLIHADDVKCTHGATSGKLDPAQQFYLESRGLDAAQARTLLTLAFIAEVVERADKALGASVDAAPGGFRAHLDATLLAPLKGRLAAGKGT